jgi:hypothetical protein
MFIIGKYYTGIGSRKTPKVVGNLFSDIGKQLENKDYILRSGGADGADSYFEKFVENKEIYLPWKNFNHNKSNLYYICDKAFEFAKYFHLNWNNLSRAAKLFQARNVYQILGHDLNNPKPSSFVVCWTPDGAEAKTTSRTGGTGQGIRIALYYQIPIFNFRNPESIRKFYNFLSLDKSMVQKNES